MESFQPMLRPTLSREEQIMLTLTQKPLMENTPFIQWLELCFKHNRPLTDLPLVQSSSDRPTVGPIKLSSDRSLHITGALSNIIACLPFKKPEECVEPVRCADVYAQILSCQVNNTET